MNWGDWIPATMVASGWSVAVWLFRQRIGAYLTRQVQHTFDVRLAEIQSEFRDNEARLQADLRVKEKQLESLQAGALSVLSSRQSGLDKRRLEAIDQIWEAFSALTPARASVSWFETLNLQQISAVAGKSEQFRQLLSSIDCSPDTFKAAADAANKARPFVTAMTWAYFSAYRSTVTFAVMHVKLLSGGLDFELLNSESVVTLVKQTLPEWSEFLDGNGISGAYSLLDELEKKLLAELQSTVDNGADDDANVGRAAKILQAARRVERNLEVSEESATVREMSGLRSR
ncbi:hypothetical protein [Burkholderia gladioli]|uniref:hypothetical protein n=1 Tax=Burkholderia gladioli TaxID=28095 RepID=UPI001C279B2E|nr:hypothetical protein [Burkholderia gladioli]MBU9382344.1 hypothetical protein [Burkholderia gladioli]